MAKQIIIPPHGGWRENTTYVVEVCFSSGNPIHQAIFYSGTLDFGEPHTFNCLMHPTYDRNMTIGEVSWLKAISIIPINFD